MRKPAAIIGRAYLVPCWPAADFARARSIGRTNQLAETPLDRPVHFQEVLATIYHHLGIDLERTTVTDLNGRPRYLVEDHRPIAELLLSGDAVTP